MFLVVPGASSLTVPPPPRDPAQRETLGGAWQRWERRLEPATRQDEFDSIGVGPRGTINSMRGEQLRFDQWPSLVDRPLQQY